MCKFCSFIAIKNNDVLELVMFNAEERLTEENPDSHSRIVEVKLGSIQDSRCNKYEYIPGKGLVEDSICDDIILFEDVKDRIEKFSKTKEFLRICTIALSRGEGCTDFIPEDKKEIVEKILNEYACQCAESVLHIFEEGFPNDKRPRQAIEMKRKWMKGEATCEELEEAAGAAERAAERAAGAAERAAERAAEAADGAAERAAEAADRAAYWAAGAAGAAGRAAYWAARAAERAAYWAARAAENQERSKQVEMLRKLMEEML